MATSVGKLFVEMGFKSTEFDVGMKRTELRLKNLNSMARKTNAMMSSAVSAGFKVAAAAVAGFGAAVVVTGAKFEQAMATVAAISGTTGGAFQSLEDHARQLGATTTFSATEAATAMQDLARAGLSANQIIEASGPALAFAGAMGADMSQATRMLASSMAQFGLEANDSTRIVDTFTSAINSSLLDISKLEQAMKYAGTTGDAFGMTIEDTTAAVGMFANLGLEGSQAGTNFRMSMIAAGKASSKKEAILKELGHTMAQINPEFHTFEQIMQLVHSSGMSATQAIEIFGTRAGANVHSLAQQVGEQTDAWVDLNAAISDSAGKTADTYETMTDTVQGQFTILKSTVQEVMLSLWEGIGDGLKDLLQSWVEVFQLVGAVLSDSDISGEWGTMLDGMAAGVKENRVEIAGQLVHMIQSVGELVQSFMALIPWIKAAAKIMLSIFVYQKVSLLAGVIGGALTSAFAAASAAGWSLSAAINSMSFGLPAIIGGIAALVTGIGLFSSSSQAATNDAANMQDQMERTAASQAAAAEASRKALEATLPAHRDWLHSLEEELQASGNLTNVVKGEIERMREMEAERLDELSQTGAVFRAEIEGRGEVWVSTELAMRLASQEGSAQAAIYSDALAAQAQALQAATTGHAENVAELEVSQARNLAASEAVETYTTTEDGATVTRTRATQAAQRAADMIDTYSNMLVIHREKLAETTGAEEDFAEAMKTATQTMEREASARAAADASDDEADAIRNAARAAREYEQVLQKRAAAARSTHTLERKLHVEIAKAQGDELAVVKAALEDRLAAVAETFRKEAELYRAGSAERVAIEQRGAEAEQAARDGFVAERLGQVDDMISESQAARRRAGDTELMALIREQIAEKQVVRAGHAEALLAAGDNEVAQLATSAQFNDKFRSLQEEQARERTALIRRLETAAVKETQGEILDARRAGMSELDRLNAEEIEAKIIATTQGADAVAAVDELFMIRRGQLMRATQAKVLAITSEGTAEALRLEQERDDLLANMAGMSGAQRAAVVEHYEGLIASAMEPPAELENSWGALTNFMIRTGRAAGTDLAAGFQTLGNLGKQTGEALKQAFVDSDVGDAVQGMGDDIQSAISRMGDRIKFSGFGEAMGDAADSAKGKLGDAAEWVGDKWEDTSEGQVGQTFRAVMGGMGEAAKGLGQIGKGAGEAMATGAAVAAKAVEGIVKAVQAVSNAVGAMNSAWTMGLDAVAQLTGFTFNLSDAVGEINDQMTERAELEAQLAAGGLSGDEMADIDAQLAELPATTEDAAATYVTDLVNGAIDMVRTFAEGAPVLLQELAAQIPSLLQAIGEALPEIIQGIAEAIPLIIDAIVNSLPVVIQALVESLPLLIQSILEAIPTVIQALGEAIPVLLGVVTDAIVMILDALPGIIQAILAQLPTIITALVDAIGSIIMGIVDAIPKIIRTVIEALPTIVMALVNGILSIVILLVEQIPMLINEVISLIPMLLMTILELIPVIIMAVVEALPSIIENIVDSIPDAMFAIIGMIPTLIGALIEALPEIIKALIFELVPALIVAVAELALGFVQAIGQFFADLLTEIGGFIRHPFDADKRPVTDTFGDTPGAQQAGQGGALVGFKAGDFFAAAQNPMDLLQQAAAAVVQGAAQLATPQGMAMAGGGSQLVIPALEGLGAAMMTAADTMAGAGGAGGAADVRVTVTAEGRTLDDVLYVGGKRGHTPHLEREIRRTSGAHVGFDRGRFAPSS